MSKSLKFIDLFAGIGGFHIALKSLKMKCVLTCEIDEYARKTYLHNFKEQYLKNKNLFPKDIWNIDFKKIPDFDILCAGFPCQPFSQVGQKKGFKDNKSGNLFFAIEEILKIKKPTAFILENVSFLKNHDNGKTFKTIYKKLNKLNYSFDAQILKASNYGLPTHRPRIFMVGFYKPKMKSSFKNHLFTFPKKVSLKKTMSDVMGGFCSTDFSGKKERKVGFTMRVGGGRSGVLDRRNWDSYIINKKEVRISPEQGLELMGFPKSFKFPVSNSQALKQLGNSVAVNVVKEVGKKTIDHLKLYKN
jgi:DNA (cytosine-5)-methyltransferase 1